MDAARHESGIPATADGGVGQCFDTAETLIRGGERFVLCNAGGERLRHQFVMMFAQFFDVALHIAARQSVGQAPSLPQFFEQPAARSVFYPLALAT